jgi:indolepyruvate ferredoxin oxidoreductase
VLTGFAWQRGLIPLDRGAIMRAIELNGASVEENKRAFEVGREAAVDPARITEKVTPPPKLAKTLDEIVEIRARDLAAYQDAAYSNRYRAFVEKARDAEQRARPGSEAFATAVARNLYKLMAIKDEYEVARLYSDGAFAKRLKEKFDGDVKLALHLAPPIFGARNPDTGVPEKRTFGPWIFTALKLLAKGKRLRGTRFDFFGRTAERKEERALLADYEARIEKLLPALSPGNVPLAAAYANVPDMIRGFGHIKAANAKKAEARYAEIETALFSPAAATRAAE